LGKIQWTVNVARNLGQLTRPQLHHIDCHERLPAGAPSSVQPRMMEDQ
jgi:hypothetical protein